LKEQHRKTQIDAAAKISKMEEHQNKVFGMIINK